MVVADRDSEGERGFSLLAGAYTNFGGEGYRVYIIVALSQQDF
jgi:hypothetical protein